MLGRYSMLGACKDILIIPGHNHGGLVPFISMKAAQWHKTKVFILGAWVHAVEHFYVFSFTQTCNHQDSWWWRNSDTTWYQWCCIICWQTLLEAWTYCKKYPMGHMLYQQSYWDAPHTCRGWKSSTYNWSVLQCGIQATTQSSTV